jgi:hypothetical protein
MHDADGNPGTHFQAGENIYVNITTTIFTTDPTKGKITLFDFNGNNIADTGPNNPFGLISDDGTNRTFTGMLDLGTIILADDHYLVLAELRTQGQGSLMINFNDVVKFGTGGSVQKSIELSKDPSFTSTNYRFGSRDKIYIKVYTGSLPDPANSDIIFLNYFGQSAQIGVDQRVNKTITSSGSYSIIELDLANDIDFENLGSGFESGDWFTIQLDLRDSIGDPLAKDWSAQLRISPGPEITATNADPSSIELVGSATTNITVEFNDPDAKGKADFKVTLKVRDPVDNIFTLIDDLSDGQSTLVIFELGSGNYRANFTWNPPDYLARGTYDLYSKITDANNSADMDEFDDNKEELELTTTSSKPALKPGTTWCSPVYVDAAEGDTTTISANFTDPLGTPPANLKVTFKVRSPKGTEITLVNAKGDGGNGEFGRTVKINEDKNWYIASYVWDPPADSEVGDYDLYFYVAHTSGNATDTFENNSNELYIDYLGLAPVIKVDSVTASPSSLDKIGNIVTKLSAEFSDEDDHLADEFDITMSIRNTNNDVVLLLDGVGNGESGEFGGILNVERIVPTKYNLSYLWDPDETIPEGVYDVSLEVVDPEDKSDHSGYNENNDKLTIISSITNPVLTAGGTQVEPSIVNKIGTGTTRIFSEFTDTGYKNATDFNITFNVKDPNNKVLTLVDAKATGGSGEDGGTVKISYSGTVFIAEYRWDPPETVLEGDYDLFFAVKNKGGGYVEDGFGRNIDELEILNTTHPPVITKSNITCDPDELEITTTNTTVFTAHFTDISKASITSFKASIKLRNESGGILTLADKLASGATAPYGGTITIENGTEAGIYNVSYEWDPPNTTWPGKYDLYFAVQDETLALAEDGFDNNDNELTLTHADIGPVTPTEGPKLTGIKISKEDDNWYNFSVDYSNTNELPPDDNGVVLVLDGEEYEMKEANASDNNYLDGKGYYLRFQLTEEDHKYSIKVNDTGGDGIELSEETYNPAEEKEDHEEHAEEHDTSAQVAATVVLIVIILILLLLFSRRKKPVSTEGMPEERVGAEEVAEEPSEEPPMAEPVEGDVPEAEPAPEAEPVDDAEAAPAAPAEPVEAEDKE